MNFLIDMIILLFVQSLARDDTKKWRIALGAFVASLIVPISLFFPHLWITKVSGKIAYSVIIVLVSFRFYSIRRLLTQLFLFYFATFTIGGGLIAIHFLLHGAVNVTQGGALTFSGHLGTPVNWLFVTIGFPFMWWFTKVRMDRHAADKIHYEQLCPVTVQLKKKARSTTGYIDSGNQLFDPLSKKAVVVCDEPFLQSWFSDSDWAALKASSNSLDVTKIPDGWRDYIHIVPFQGIEGKNRFMLAIRPDHLIVYHDGKKLITHKVLLGIQFASLAKDQSYHCLLHPQIIKMATICSA